MPAADGLRSKFTTFQSGQFQFFSGRTFPLAKKGLFPPFLRALLRGLGASGTLGSTVLTMPTPPREFYYVGYRAFDRTYTAATLGAATLAGAHADASASGKRTYKAENNPGITCRFPYNATQRRRD